MVCRDTCYATTCCKPIARVSQCRRLVEESIVNRYRLSCAVVALESEMDEYYGLHHTGKPVPARDSRSILAFGKPLHQRPSELRGTKKHITLPSEDVRLLKKYLIENLPEAEQVDLNRYST